MTGGSRVVDAIREATVDPVVTTWRAWTAGSAVGDILSTGRAWLARLAAGARTIDVLDALSRWTRCSALYQWLTAEPEPEVIVIDLRETVTVRPFLIGLDESIGLLLLGRRTSIVGATAATAGRRLRTAPLRVASFVLLFALVVSTGLGALLGTVDATGLWIRGVLATLALGGTRIDCSWEWFRESRPARLLVALLEPPEPPEYDKASRDEHERESVE